MHLVTFVQNLYFKCSHRFFYSVSSIRESMLALSSKLHGRSFPSNVGLYLLAVLIHPYLYTFLYGFLFALYLKLFGRNRTVILVWDYEVMPTKFGDYIWGLTVVKLLAHYCQNVLFIEILAKSGTYFKKSKTNEETAANNFVKSRQQLQAYFVNMQNVRYQTLPSLKAFTDSSISTNNVIVLQKHVTLRKYVLHYYHNFISPLFFMLGNKEKLLFNNSLKQQDPNLFYHYSTHFRFNPSRPQKDAYSHLMFELFELFKFPLFVSSDYVGIEYLKKLSPSGELKPCIGFREESDYCADIHSILSSKFYFQFRGGGVGGPVGSSTKQPYLVAQIGGFLIPWGPKKMFSYSLDCQLFTTNLDFSWFKKQIILRLTSDEYSGVIQNQHEK